MLLYVLALRAKNERKKMRRKTRARFTIVQHHAAPADMNPRVGSVPGAATQSEEKMAASHQQHNNATHAPLRLWQRAAAAPIIADTALQSGGWKLPAVRCSS